MRWSSDSQARPVACHRWASGNAAACRRPRTVFERRTTGGQMSPPRGSIAFAPETRVVVRDAAWLARRVDMSFDGGQHLTCGGTPELVRSQESLFLTSLGKDIKGLDSEEGQGGHGDWRGCTASRLFIESQMRQARPSDD